MRFNWIVDFDLSEEMKKLSVDMEYLLREKISRFLISNWGDSVHNFEQLVFDIDMVTKEITISKDSPSYLRNIIEEDFYKEFNPGHSSNQEIIV